MSELQPFPIRDTDVTHVVIEMFGGDNNLSHFALEDLQEMVAGNRGPFSVLALTDFEDGEACVIELSPRTGNHVVAEWGEVDTGDPDILATFLSRALVSYDPQVHTAIGFWDHGSGVFDDHDPDETLLERRLSRIPRHRRARSVPARRLLVPRARVANSPRARALLHDDTIGGLIASLEVGTVLRAAFDRAGRAKPVDLIFSDTCLNGMIEVLDELKDFARVIVASEDLEPGDGWDYHEWFARMSDKPPQTAEEWGEQAVEAFKASYEDRRSMYPCTLGAFATTHEITAAFTQLCQQAEAEGKNGFLILDGARRRTQGFANKDTYDMAHFFDNVVRTAPTHGNLVEAARAARDTFDKAHIAHVALGKEVSDSQGLAFWFPSSRSAFRRCKATYEHLAFAHASGWVDYLADNFE